MIGKNVSYSGHAESSIFFRPASQDSVYATILELVWPDGNTDGNKPKIYASFVKTSNWEPDPILAEENERAYDALAPLRNTELARVPPPFEPLSSVNSRGKVCTMVSQCKMEYR